MVILVVMMVQHKIIAFETGFCITANTWTKITKTILVMVTLMIIIMEWEHGLLL